MTVRILGAHLALVLGLAACVATPGSRLEVSQDTADPTVSSALQVPAELSAGLAGTCEADQLCPANYSCVERDTFDCGEEFCRTPGVQCNAQPSTFIHVEHVELCTLGTQTCWQVVQGRRLVNCGC